MLNNILNQVKKIENNSIEIINLVKNKLVTNNFINNLHETTHWVNDYVEYGGTNSTNITFNKNSYLKRF